MSDQFIGKVLAGKYQVGEVISETDLGKLYHGTHLLMEKPVTIKILSPTLAVDAEIVRQFSAEAKTASRVSHPNILNVTDFNADQNGTVYMVMESGEGETLKNALGREEQLSKERAFSIARQIAAALSAAHSAGVVHRSLNTENILLIHDISHRETVKVLGFGSTPPIFHQNLDEEEEFSDNLKYLAPEQDLSVSELDERSDIYSLGVILYEMLAGETPFSAETSADLTAKKIEELPAPLSAFRADLPDGVEPVILKSLAKNPEMRQQTAAEFAEELNQATNYDGEQETIVIPRREAEDASNNIWKTAFIVLAGISLMAIGLIYATSVKQTDPQTQMQFDANGQPVQPLNPATGMNEQGAANMIPFSANAMEDANVIPQTIPGGDGYDPWGAGTAPPPGAPQPVYPSGEVYTIPGNSGSVFMPQDGVILVPVPANSNSNTQPSPAKTPKETQANTQASPSPKASPAEAHPTPPAEIKPSPPAKTPAPKPTENKPPASTEKKPESGKKQDS